MSDVVPLPRLGHVDHGQLTHKTTQSPILNSETISTVSELERELVRYKYLTATNTVMNQSKRFFNFCYPLQAFFIVFILLQYSTVPYGMVHVDHIIIFNIMRMLNGGCA